MVINFHICAFKLGLNVSFSFSFSSTICLWMAYVINKNIKIMRNKRLAREKRLLMWLILKFSI